MQVYFYVLRQILGPKISIPPLSPYKGGIFPPHVEYLVKQSLSLKIGLDTCFLVYKHVIVYRNRFQVRNFSTPHPQIHLRRAFLYQVGMLNVRQKRFYHSTQVQKLDFWHTCVIFNIDIELRFEILQPFPSLFTGERRGISPLCKI